MPKLSDVAFDTSVAHPARIYDYWLGGKDNFAADRLAAEEVLAVMPAIAQVARSVRMPPGITPLGQWAPGAAIPGPATLPTYTALARKPAIA